MLITIHGASHDDLKSPLNSPTTKSLFLYYYSSTVMYHTQQRKEAKPFI